MPNNLGKEWTFNTVADSYEKIRPGYPDELYQALFAYVPLDDSCITIEESIRERFFDAVEDTINRHGGSISIFDTIDLQMARKPYPDPEKSIPAIQAVL